MSAAPEVLDEEDLARARPASEPVASNSWWKCLGPGLITGAADDDPSGIGTYSVAGAQYGYALLWLVPICIPLMIAVQEMCGRIGVVTGKGLAAAIKDQYPRWVLHGSILLLVGANVTNIYADLNVMAASSQMLFKGSFWLWLTLISLAIILAQVFVPYRYYVKLLKWLCLTLLAYAVVALLPSVHNNWPLICRGLFVPTWKTDSAFVLTVVGFLGTTISPYLFFWQASEEVEEEIRAGTADAPGHRTVPASRAELRSLRSDTVVGMFASQIVTFFIMICTAATLHERGITNINTAEDAAKALLPLGGTPAYWLFALGILGTGALAIPTLAGSVGYAAAEAYDWRYGLYRRAKRAKPFYLTIAISIFLGYCLNFVHALSPVKALLYSAVINGVFAPPLLVILILVCNNKKIFGERCNHRLSNVLGWLTVIFMGTTSAVMIWSLVTGKSS